MSVRYDESRRETGGLTGTSQSQLIKPGDEAVDPFAGSQELVVSGAPVWSGSPAGDPIDRLIEAWVRVAMRHARVREADDLFVADVVGVSGAWIEGESESEALESLPDVLTEWVRLKLDDGDTDIPPMEGLHLVIRK